MTDFRISARAARAEKGEGKARNMGSREFCACPQNYELVMMDVWQEYTERVVDGYSTDALAHDEKSFIERVMRDGSAWSCQPP